MNSRKQFEAWIKPLWHLETFKGGDDSLQYRDEVIQGQWEAWQAASKASEHQLAAVVAENAGLKQANGIARKILNDDETMVTSLWASSIQKVEMKTPATDAYLAEVRAQARNEGAHFVANRMLAAWDAGFIDDTAKNAADIARMILTSTEFMADAPEGDFDRSFADGVLEDIAAQLRQGAEHE